MRLRSSFVLLLAGLSAPVSAGTLSGQVLGDDGEAVAGAGVYAWNQQLAAVSTLAGSDGSFVIDDVPVGTWRLRAYPPTGTNRVSRFLPAERDFCSSTSVTLASGDSADGLDFALPEGAVISGVILDAAGEPVVAAVLEASGADASVEGLSRLGLTGGEGDFEVVGLEVVDATAEYLVELDHDDFPDQFLGASYTEEDAALFEVDAQGLADAGTHTLLDGIIVSGRVEGPEGPVTDADVLVYAGGQVRTVPTDEAGDYVAFGLPPGDVLPWASSEEIATTYWPDADRPESFLTADEGEELDGVDIFAPAEAVFQAEFIDAEDGTSVGSVQALIYNDTYTVGRGTRSDEDGLLAIDQLHGGTYFLYVWAESKGYADGWVADADGERLPFEVEGEVVNEVLSIDLVPAAGVSGLVVDEDGAPVLGATVVASRTDGSVATDSTDEDGAFQLGGMGSGDWSLYAVLESVCPGDPSFVPVFHPETVNPDWTTPISLDTGEQRDGVAFTLPADADQDGMGDRWEDEVGLDPTSDDAADDPDEDGYVNLVEYRLGTDPFGVNTATGCGAEGGCRDGSAAGLLLLSLLGLRRRRL